MTTLKSYIIDKIRQSDGKISFSDYMEMALYTPELGYYMKNAIPLGRQGDFITAPELSPLFGLCVARAIQPVLNFFKNTNKHPIILEFGAGTGKLAKILLESCLDISQYFIIEISPELRKLQKKNLDKYLSKIIWIDSLDKLPEESIEGVILANEVMDAFPVTRFLFKNNTVWEYYVGEDNNNFEWLLEKSSDAEIISFVNQLALASPYTSEINLILKSWIKKLSKSLKSGIVLLFDYGFPRHEFYHPDRHEGTLMCHYQQHSNTDPFYLPGLQDITSHIDFTLVAESALSAELEVSGYTSQAAFLLECGILDFAESFQDNQAIKLLTLPHEMGELFKASVLSKNYDLPIRGFEFQDRRNSL